jgi:hypothetical protein
MIRLMKSRCVKSKGHVARVRNVYKILTGRPDGKGQVGRPRRRWEDDIIIVLREIELEVVDWSGHL